VLLKGAGYFNGTHHTGPCPGTSAIIAKVPFTPGNELSETSPLLLRQVDRV
jgi:hypothetical protein